MSGYFANAANFSSDWKPPLPFDNGLAETVRCYTEAGKQSDEHSQANCQHNGPEFTEREVRRWLSRLGVKTLFIEPSSHGELRNSGQVENIVRCRA